MKTIVTIAILAVFCLSFLSVMASSDFKMEGGTINTLVDTYTGSIIDNNRSRFDVPDYNVIYPPISLMTSYYDYFPGNYGSFPMVSQPTPAGNFDGGGIYTIYQATSQAGAVRRIYYSYILDGLEQSTSLINLAGTASEGFPGVDMDSVSGEPFVSWHGARADNHPFWVNYLTFDQYSLVGITGLWNNPYVVTDNPDIGDEYIWPVVKIGNSPTPGMRRVYVVGSNANAVGTTTQGHNAYISFADFTTSADLSNYNAADWTHYEIPYMRDWALDGMRPYFDFAVSDDGKVVIAGTIFDWGSYGDVNWPGGYSDNDVLFVLMNDNWGDGSTEADWQLYTDDSNIAVANPDGYFEDSPGIPHDNVYMVPFAPRFSIDLNEQGDVIFSLNYRLSAGQANTFFYDQVFTKFVKFHTDFGQFSVTDIYPRSENHLSQPYVPWDPEGDGQWSYDTGGLLNMTMSWCSYWWADMDYQPENYTRVAQSGSRVAVVFQESMKARMINEYGDNDYAGWQDKPETYIMVSDDYGTTWADPIIMNANPTDSNYVPELSGMIPAYVYPGDTIDDLGNGWGRLHLFFYDMNDYGSYLQGNGPNTGGNLSYMALDIDFSGSFSNISITSTFAGEVFEADESVTILWNALPDISNVLIDYTVDNGATWLPVTDTPLNAAIGEYVWTVPDTPGEVCRLKVKCADNNNDFAISGLFSIVLGYVEAPQFDPEGGTYHDSQTIYLTSSTPEADLEYSFDGENWETGDSVQLFNSSLLYARATMYGWVDSEIVHETYYILNAPYDLYAEVFTDTVNLIWEGPYQADETGVDHGVSTTRAARRNRQSTSRIPLGYNVYRHDGAAEYELLNDQPLLEAEYQDNGLQVGEYTYKVTTVYEQGSSDPSNEVTITVNMTASPEFSLEPGEYEGAIFLDLTCNNEDALIYYTMDESDPSEESTLYEEPIHITAPTTIKARAFKENWLPSEIVEGYYEFSTNVTDETTPLIATALHPAYPNPFNPQTTIPFSLKKSQQVSIVIYNLKGHRVITLVDDSYSAGNHHTVWYGVDGKGVRVASGVYFCIMESGSERFMNKILLLK